MSALGQLQTELARVLSSDAFGNQVRISTADLRAAEYRLQIVLPVALKEFYEIFGCASRLLNSYNHIFGVEDLRIEAGALLFVEEREKYYRWGITIEHLVSADPPVFQSTVDGAEWISYGDSLECFLGTMLCWQSLNLMAGMATTKYQGKFTEKASVFLSPISSLGIRCSSQEDSVALIGRDIIAVAYPKQSIVYLGGSDEALGRFADQIDVGLNYL